MSSSHYQADLDRHHKHPKTAGRIKEMDE